MSPDFIALPGFERWIATLKQYGIGADPRPASAKAPGARDRLLGSPMDPLLAELYSRCDGGRFGDLEIFGFGCEEANEVLRWNEFDRALAMEFHPQIAKCIQYGKEMGEPRYLATVPSLADPQGIQPVVCIDDFTGLHFYPLASSADKAFDLWARYAEPRLRKHGMLTEYILGIPTYYVTEQIQLIAEDAPLVRMLEAGTFDEIVGDDPPMHQWIQSVLQAVR